MAQAVAAHTLPPTVSQMAILLRDEWAAVDTGKSDAQLAAIEGYILDAPAISLEDAAAQLMVTYGRLSDAPVDQLRELRPRLEFAMLSVWRVVAVAAAASALLDVSPRYVPTHSLIAI